MKVVGGDAKVSILGWWNTELAPQRVDVLLLVVDPGKLHHVEAGGRVCPVGADEVVVRDLDLGRSACHTQVVGLGGFAWDAAFKPCFVGAEVRTCQLVVEEELDIRFALQLVEEGIVQGAPIDCIDRLGPCG